MILLLLMLNATQPAVAQVTGTQLSSEHQRISEDIREVKKEHEQLTPAIRDLTRQIRELHEAQDALIETLKPIASQLSILLTILQWIVGSGGTLWVGDRAIRVARNSGRVNAMFPERRGDPRHRRRTGDDGD